MLSSIRKQLKSSGFQFILWLTLFSLVGGYFIGPVIRSIFFGKEPTGFALVNNLEIPISIFRRQVSSIYNFINEIKKSYGSKANMLLSFWGLDTKTSPEKLVLDELIKQKLIQSNAEYAGINIGFDYISKKLSDQYFVRQNLANIIPIEVFQNGKLSTKLLSEVLNKQSISFDEFDDFVKEIIEREIFFNLIESLNYVPSFILKEEYLKKYAKRKFNIIDINLENYIKKVQENKISEKELTEYFNNNKENYKIPEKRSIELWQFKPDDYNIVISENEIKNYYDKNKRNYIEKNEEIKVKRILIKFSEKAEEKAKELHEQLKLDSSLFDKLADKFSSVENNIITLKHNSNYEWPFEQAAFELKNKNNISDIVKTKDGYEIIKLIDRIEPVYKSFESVKNNIEQQLREEKFQKQFNNDAQRIIGQIKDIPAIFDNFIKDKKALKSEKDNIELDGTLMAEKTFDLLKINDYGFYQDQNNGYGYILKLKSITQSLIPELSSIKDKVTNDIYRYKARELLNKDLENNVKSNKDIEKIAQYFKTNVEKTDWIELNKDNNFFNNKKIDKKALKELINVKKKFYYLAENNGYIIELSEIEPLNDKDFNNKKEQINAEFSQRQLKTILDDLLINWQSKAKIVINNKYK